MTMTDPIADMLTRLRNANSAYHETVAMPYSKIKAHIAEILQQEGYIQAWAVGLGGVIPFATRITGIVGMSGGRSGRHERRVGGATPRGDGSAPPEPTTVRPTLAAVRRRGLQNSIVAPSTRTLEPLAQTRSSVAKRRRMGSDTPYRSP